MSHNTVESVGGLGGISTKTGGMPATHNLGRLKAAYPASPLYKKYDPEKVASLKKKVLMNDVTRDDRGDAQSYWGFPQTDANEPAPSGVDLSYAGAPDLSLFGNINPEKEPRIPVPYFPRLPTKAPSPDDEFAEIVRRYKKANQKSGSSFPGSGILSPKKSSDDIRKLSLGDD